MGEPGYDSDEEKETEGQDQDAGETGAAYQDAFDGENEDDEDDEDDDKQ